MTSSRVVGALVLVYGLPLSKIAYLTRDDITRHDGQTWLRHHGRQILLPPRLAALIGQLALQPTPGTILIRLAGPPSWLFPGNGPTRPASHAHLRTGLRRHGITTHAARNTAVGALAAELPAPVLAGITGLHISTATRWTRAARRDWTEYVAARTPHQNKIAGDEGPLQYARHSPRLHGSTKRPRSSLSTAPEGLPSDSFPSPEDLLSRRVNGSGKCDKRCLTAEVTGSADAGTSLCPHGADIAAAARSKAPRQVADPGRRPH